ncbi:MAG TPA: S8 family serine peptidase [Acidimicrobiales bacterium]
MSGGTEPAAGAPGAPEDDLDPEEVQAAHRQVTRALGTAVASKASPMFLVAAARTLQQAPPPAGVGLEGFTAFRVQSPAVPAPTIVEFAPVAATPASSVPASPVPGAAPAGPGTPATPAAAPAGPGGSAATALPVAAARALAVQQARTEAYQRMGPVYDEIERVSTGSLRSAGGSGGAPSVSTLLNQVCWLNHTVRTFAHPVALAEVAEDDTVATLDVPRRLQAEQVTWRPNLATVGVPVFREETDLTGKDVIVAVIDSEVSLRHPALAGRVVHRRNFTAEGWGNPHPHGTAVAGIIAADDPTHGGVAPGAVIYNYKVLAGPISAEDFGGALAIQMALEDGAVVANCSWGAGPAGDGTSREARAVDAAWQLGMVVVKSSGNAGPDDGTMSSPADAAGVIVVGATDIDGDTVQHYSSRGPVHVRPGPHLVAPGGSAAERIESCDVAGGFAPTPGPGTSYAAPHVTGMVALLAEREPEWSPDQVRDHLVAAAEPIDGVEDEAQGAGLARITAPR